MAEAMGVFNRSLRSFSTFFFAKAVLSLPNNIHLLFPIAHDFTGHRLSISFMISSAHRTASAIAHIVARTRFPASYLASFRAARITRLRPSVFTSPVSFTGIKRMIVRSHLFKR